MSISHHVVHISIRSLKTGGRRHVRHLVNRIMFCARTEARFARVNHSFNSVLLNPLLSRPRGASGTQIVMINKGVLPLRDTMFDLAVKTMTNLYPRERIGRRTIRINMLRRLNSLIRRGLRVVQVVKATMLVPLTKGVVLFRPINSSRHPVKIDSDLGNVMIGEVVARGISTVLPALVGRLLRNVKTILRNKISVSRLNKVVTVTRIELRVRRLQLSINPFWIFVRRVKIGFKRGAPVVPVISIRVRRITTMTISVPRAMPSLFSGRFKVLHGILRRRRQLDNQNVNSRRATLNNNHNCGVFIINRLAMTSRDKHLREPLTRNTNTLRRSSTMNNNVNSHSTLAKISNRPLNANRKALMTGPLLNNNHIEPGRLKNRRVLLKRIEVRIDVPIGGIRRVISITLLLFKTIFPRRILKRTITTMRRQLMRNMRITNGLKLMNTRTTKNVRGTKKRVPTNVRHRLMNAKRVRRLIVPLERILWQFVRLLFNRLKIRTGRNRKRFATIIITLNKRRVRLQLANNTCTDNILIPVISIIQ